MRRALIACIHGNLVALEAVLKDIAAEGVDEIVCLGDIIGECLEWVDCIELIRSKCAWSLCGDEDVALFVSPPDGFKPFKRSRAHQRQFDLLKPSWHSGPAVRLRWKWLETLDARKTDRNTLFVHGSPRDPLMEYVNAEDFDPGVLKKESEKFDFPEPICFCAHSHRPGVVQFMGFWKRPEMLNDSRESIVPGRRYLVNIGSVGQPRDGDPRSCYVIWDDDSRVVTFHRVPYNVESLRGKLVQELDWGERYWHRLKEGR